MNKVLNEESDNDKYLNFIEQKIVDNEVAIKCLTHNDCIVFGFTAEVQDEIITNTKYKT
jgi:hypothetical protein